MCKFSLKFLNTVLVVVNLYDMFDVEMKLLQNWIRKVEIHPNENRLLMDELNFVNRANI